MVARLTLSLVQMPTVAPALDVDLLLEPIATASREKGFDSVPNSLLMRQWRRGQQACYFSLSLRAKESLAPKIDDSLCICSGSGIVSEKVEKSSAGRRLSLPAEYLSLNLLSCSHTLPSREEVPCQGSVDSHRRSP